MDVISEVKKYGKTTDLLPFMYGSPGPDTLRDCKDIFLKATADILKTDDDVARTFSYGPARGDSEFLDELAKFLSMEYKDSLNSSNLMLTAGATQATDMIINKLVGKNALAFVEDPTYFAAYMTLKQDFQMDIVSVPCDEDGMKMDVLDALLTKHKPEVVTSVRPFWSLIYVTSVFNNPTGICYSRERCMELVRLSRKHNVLVLCDDMYNLIYFGENSPKRLLAYDNKSDSAYKGNVVSNCSFSKMLAPGLRLGWLEAPEYILDCLHNSTVWSGGSLNHYGSRLAAAILRLGLQEQHVALLRKTYKERMSLMCDILETNLPTGSHINRPQGGTFVWVRLPDSIDTMVLLRYAVEKYKINFLPGFLASPSGGSKNYVRLSVSYCNNEDIGRGVGRFCSAVYDLMEEKTQ